MPFVPAHKEIYPDNFKLVHYDLGEIENTLEGYYRPGHFQGVCLVVNRLLDLIKPSKIYLGSKDYQQCRVIQKMLTLINLNSVIELSMEPTIRDEFGLALSSRNLRLTEVAKQKALILINCLKHSKETLLKQGEVYLNQIQKNAIDTILKAGFESVDYFQFVDEDFKIIHGSENTNKIVALLTAATIEGVRLIDNIEISNNEYAK
jgi:pantoate--beta-alanine ligase